MLKGFGVPASQLASPGSVGFSPDIAVPPRDVAAARRLLDEAGVVRPLTVDLDLREDRSADEIRRQLAEAGIEARLRPLPWGEALRRMRAGQALFYYGAMVADTGDAGDILDSALHTPTRRRVSASTTTSGTRAARSTGCCSRPDPPPRSSTGGTRCSGS